MNFIFPHRNNNVFDQSQLIFNDIKIKPHKLIEFTFYTNLENFIKNNKKILSEIDQTTKFLRLKKQQESFIANNFQKVYNQCAEKLVQECLARNSNISNTINKFDKIYRTNNIITIENQNNQIIPIVQKQINSKKMQKHIKPGSFIITKNDQKHQIIKKSPTKIQMLKILKLNNQAHVSLKNSPLKHKFNNETNNKILFTDNIQKQPTIQIFNKREQKINNPMNKQYDIGSQLSNLSTRNNPQIQNNEKISFFLQTSKINFVLKKKIFQNEQLNCKLNTTCSEFRVRNNFKNKINLQKIPFPLSLLKVKQKSERLNKDEQIKQKIKQKIMNITSNSLIKVHKNNKYMARSKFRYPTQKN